MFIPGLVSIIIPAWKATWFEAALQSALHQDYANCEIIIGDDSKDNEISRIVEENRQHCRWPLFYQHNIPSLGEMKNTADCLDRARGEFIKFLHDDDILKPDCVSKLVAAINQHPDIVMSTSHREMIDAEGVRLPDHQGTAPLFNCDSVLNGHDVINFEAGQPLNFIGEPSVVLIRTAILRATRADGDPIFVLGGQPMPFLADLAIYLKVLRYGHLAMVTQTLVQYRISGSQTLATVNDNAEQVRATHRNMPLVLKKLGWHNPDRAYGQIRVAPLTQPDQFNEHNLSDEISASLTRSRLNMWLDSRKLRPVQQQLLNEYLTTDLTSSRCTLFIDARNAHREAWELTLCSLNVTQISWQIIALTNGQVDYLPAQVEQVRLDLAEGLATLNDKSQILESDWILFVDAGCQLLPSGLNALSTTLRQAEQYNAIYTDMISLREGKPQGMLFRPDFNLDFFLSSPEQMSRGWLFKRKWVIAAGGFNPACSEAFELELQLRLIESSPLDKIGHLHEPLLLTAKAPVKYASEQRLLLEHLHRRGFPQAEVLPTPQGPWRLKYNCLCEPGVTIVILACNFQSVSRCVMSVLEFTGYSNYELLIVADERADAERERWLEGIVSLASERIKVLHFPAAWKRAAIANHALLNASGEYVLFLNSNIEVRETDWLENMLVHALRPEVAIVGGKQLYPNNLIRHAGYILGMRGGVAGEPFYGLNDSQNGYMSRLHADQNYSAVSGDFMLVRKDICYAVNGFDADLDWYDDIDFCLRVSQLGGLIVWTPYAKGYRHPESTGCNPPASRHEEEENIIFARWLPLISQDPAYNKNLSMTKDFMLQSQSENNWLPLTWRPLPVVVSVIGVPDRISFYRMTEPFTALRDAGFIEGKLENVLPGLPEAAAYNPDIMVIELNSSEDFHRRIKNLSRFDPAFKIAVINFRTAANSFSSASLMSDLDEYIVSVKRYLTYFDRLIVSNEKEAELFTDVHSDIIIMPPCLPQASWSKLGSLCNQDKKKRIGLPTALCHGKIAEIMIKLIKAFADDVEWIVYGACSPELTAIVDKIIPETDFEIYHQVLAQMHLDLALVPHDGHPLTHAQAYYHLLEYSAMGIPIICSRSLNSENNLLTATAVTDSFTQWYNAISAHLNEPDPNNKMSKRLHDEVRQRWLLDEDRLEMWSTALKSK